MLNVDQMSFETTNVKVNYRTCSVWFIHFRKHKEIQSLKYMLMTIIYSAYK